MPKDTTEVSRAKEIIALQSDLILIEGILTKSKHEYTIRGLNDIKSSINDRTYNIAGQLIGHEAQGGNE